jgi:thioredoxin reductase (NADPH)
MPDAPVLLVVDDDLRKREAVEGELRKRYGSDYEVVSVGSAADALRLLGALRDDRRELGVVLAGQWMRAMTGTELLARVREFHPAAKRVLLIDWGDNSTSEPILAATALGQMDAYVARPGTAPDERFHRAITELLDDLGRSRLPPFEAVRVVGEEWSARSHEIRELLGRNGIPFGLYPADQERGRALLARPARAGRRCR